MLDGIRPVQNTGTTNKTSAPQRAEQAAAPFSVPADSGIPATPPAEVLRALDNVQRVASALNQRGLEIRFDRTDAQDVSAKVVDVNGRVVRDIPVNHALDVLAGETQLNLEA
jgi:hypothetical protein